MNDETEQNSTANDAVTRLEDELSLRRRKARRKSRIITAVILVILTAVAVSSAVFLVTFWDRLSPESVRDYVDIRSSGNTITKIGGAADIVTGNSSVFAAFDKGLAIATTTSVRYATVDGRSGFSQNAVFSSPAISVSEKYLLVYDRLGNSLMLFDDDGLVSSSEADGKIISASVSNSGVCAVISEADGYISLLSVYDRSFSPVYKWYNSEYYCISAAYHDESAVCGATVVFEQDGDLFGRILLFNVGAEGIANSIELGLSVPTELWASSEGFTAMTDRGAAFADVTGSLTAIKTFDHPVCGYSPDGRGGVFILLAPFSLTEKYSLLHVDPAGKLSSEVTINEDVLALHASNGYLGVLTGKSATLYNTDLGVERIISQDSDIINIAVIRGGYAVLFSEDTLTVVQ